jgi:hypothetical protein
MSLGLDNLSFQEEIPIMEKLSVVYQGKPGLTDCGASGRTDSP